MATITIRVPQQTHERILRLAASRKNANIGDIVDEATRRLEDDDWFEAFNASFAALRADPVASADYDAEVAAWDVTLADGLEEWPYDEDES
jgi:hypothetical protein